MRSVFLTLSLCLVSIVVVGCGEKAPPPREISPEVEAKNDQQHAAILANQKKSAGAPAGAGHTPAK